MRLPKIGRKAKLNILKFGSLIAYATCASLYGYFEHRTGELDEWDYLADAADEHGSVYIHGDGDLNNTDNMYLILGKDNTSAIWNEIPKEKDDDET